MSLNFRNQVLEPARSIYGIVVFMVLMFLVFFTSCVVLFPESPMRAAHHLVPGFNEATFTIFFNTNMSIGTISLEGKVVLQEHRSLIQQTLHDCNCACTLLGSDDWIVSQLLCCGTLPTHLAAERDKGGFCYLYISSFLCE